MFSAEPLTVTARGDSQLFQHGEAYNGRENIDYPNELIDWLGAFTVGGVLNLSSKGPLEIGLGADATFYDVPRRLVFSTQTTLYGARPVSFHVFLRIRPRAPSMGHMWNMVMSDSAMR